MQSLPEPATLCLYVVQSADLIAEACGYHVGLLSGAAEYLYSSPGPVKPPWSGILSAVKSCTGFVHATDFMQHMQHAISLLDKADRQLLSTLQLFQMMGTRQQPVVPQQALRLVYTSCLGSFGAAPAGSGQPSR